MSSPVHQADDIDPALMYAPPWARKGAAAETPPAENDEPPVFADRARLKRQSQFLLDPEILPPPPLSTGGVLSLEHTALWLGAAAVVVGLAIWIVVSRPGAPDLPTDQTAAAAAEPAPSVGVDHRVKLMHFRAKSGPLAQASFVAEETVTPRMDRVPVQGVPSGSTAAARTTPMPSERRTPEPAGQTSSLDADEIAILIKRSREFLTNGDISSARLLLQRAADGGSAEAALTLGATFDPQVIGHFSAMGVGSDIATARKWYEKAAALGSDAAKQQLAKLSQGPN